MINSNFDATRPTSRLMLSQVDPLLGPSVITKELICARLAASVASPIFIKSLSFGMIGVLFGGQFAGFGKILASLGSDGEAAASVVSSISVFVLGAGIGFMSSTGMSLPAAASDVKKVGTVVRVAWCWGAIVGCVAIAIMEVSKYAFLSFFEHNDGVKKITADFFATFAPSVIPDFLLLANGVTAFQIAGKTEAALMPPVTLACYRVIALIAANLCIDTVGASGVGAICSGAALGGLIVSTIWLKKILGPECTLLQLDSKEDFLPAFRKFGNDGWKLALQRITEWGNIAAISISVGHAWSSAELRDIQPSVETLTFFNAFSQSFSLAAMMVVKKNFETRQKILASLDVQDTNQSAELANLTQNTHANNTIFVQYIGSGVAINAVVCVVSILISGQLSEFFLNKPEANNYGRSLFLINGIGLVPDSIRIVSSAILRGREDIMVPTIISLVIMTGVGVPLGLVINKFVWKNGILPMFIIRDVALAGAASFNCVRYYRNVYRKDFCELNERQQLQEV